MVLTNLVGWTRSKLSQLTRGDVPVMRSRDPLPSSGRVALPLFDLFENERELRLVIDVPGATPSTTRLAWNDVDTLSIHVQRAASAPGATSLAEYEELDWHREIVVSPDADGTKARSTMRDGVLTVCLPKRRTLHGQGIPVYAA